MQAIVISTKAMARNQTTSSRCSVAWPTAPLIELYIIYHELTKICASRGITITRNLVGSYMTSLEMAGCSITLLKLDAQLTELWDAPVLTPGLRWGA